MLTRASGLKTAHQSSHRSLGVSPPLGARSRDGLGVGDQRCESLTTTLLRRLVTARRSSAHLIRRDDFEEPKEWHSVRISGGSYLSQPARSVSILKAIVEAV